MNFRWKFVKLHDLKKFKFPIETINNIRDAYSVTKTST